MKFEINDNAKKEIFLIIVKNLKQFTTFLTFTLNTEYLYIQGMDSSQVSLFEVNIKKDWFSEYEVDEHVKEISVSTEILYKIINTHVEGQNITIKFDSEKAEKLEIDFTNSDEKNKEQNIYDKFFEIPIMEIDQEHLEVPEVDYEADFSITSSVMTTIMDEMSIFNENAEIFCSEENIKITANGTEGKMNTSIPIDSLNTFEIVDNETLKLVYSLDYINKIMSFNKISKEMSLHLSNDYPMKIMYSLDNDSYVRFFLAPKIDE